jgi:ABC-2 type transport system ATP-binding protein
MLCGLLRADEGSGTCLGYDIITQSDKIKKHVGYMTQKFSLYDDLTIEENLDLIARIYQMPNRSEAVAHALDRLEMGNRRRQMAGTLSGGWKQRLALACCMIHNPLLLLLDEPTAGVDPKARRDFWDEIHRLAAGGLTALVTTHYMDEAERCHRLAYIAYGNLMTQGTVEQVIQNAGLSMWSVTGDHLNKLSALLAKEHGVEMVAPFGSRLHVCGRDAKALAAVASKYQSSRLQWTPCAAELEDVFIALMKKAEDRYS